MFLLAEGGHHTPLIVEFVNHYIGEPLHEFQVHYTRPLWDKLFGYFGSNAESVFGVYTPENAVPWYTIMFVIACLLTMAVVWILKGKLSQDDPTHGQQTLEAGVLAIREMLISVVGEQGIKYFPVVATFAVLILISNLMGFFPLFMSPTAHISVTLALGLCSFLYYNYIGIKENGLVSHLGHWAGPVWWMAPLIFPIELVGNLVRPMSLGMRLFGNMFADEQVAASVSNLGSIVGLPAWTTQMFLPVLLMPLALFVAFIQTFVFTLLSMVYLSEVSHAHDEHHGGEGHEHDNAEVPAH